MTRKNNHRRLALALLAALLPLAACAQASVWRCGNSYSHQPCAGGTEVETKASAPPAQEAARAAAAARRDARLADAMEQDRLARERQAGSAIVIANAPQGARPAASAGRKKGKARARSEPELLTVTLPAPAGSRRAPRP